MAGTSASKADENSPKTRDAAPVSSHRCRNASCIRTGSCNEKETVVD